MPVHLPADNMLPGCYFRHGGATTVNDTAFITLKQMVQASLFHWHFLTEQFDVEKYPPECLRHQVPLVETI